VALTLREMRVIRDLREVVAMGRNLTLVLDDETIRRARVAAARSGLSISALMRRELQRLARDESAYQLAREAARRRLLRGQSLGGAGLPPRDELHEREDLR